MSEAILHDQLCSRGGAERVAYAMAEALDAPIYAMWVDESTVPQNVETVELAGRVGEWAKNRNYLVEDFYQMFQWQHVEDLYEYDVLIQNKTNTYWFVPHADSQCVIRYCHSTPRGMYDLFKRHGGSIPSDVLKIIQRQLHEPTTDYADTWLCNSEIVQRRARMYWDVDPTVVYPPVEIDIADPDTETEDFIFHVGRLASNKRIGLLNDVAREINTELIVAGSGPEKDRLLENKPANLTYVGYVDERSKFDYLSRAKATLFTAQDEDFGIVPIESFAAGTPVIGVNEGYTQYQIKHGRNGYLVEPTVSAIQQALSKLETAGVGWSSHDMNDFAQQFGAERFKTQIVEAVEQTRKEVEITPNHQNPIPTATHD